MKSKILIALFCVLLWPVCAFALGLDSIVEHSPLITMGVAMAFTPVAFVMPKQNASLKTLVDARKKLLDEEQYILDNPEETRGEGDDAVTNLSKEQRSRLDTLKSDLTQLDDLIASAERRADARKQQIELERRSQQPERPRIVPDMRSGFSDGEHRDMNGFSLGRVVQLLSEGRSLEQLDGIEGEMAIEGRKEAIESGIEVRGRSVMISGNALMSAERRDMTATGGTNLNQGGNTIATGKMPLLDSLMNRLVFSELGATVLTGLVGNFDAPRLVDGTSPSGKAENAAADEYSPTTTQVSFSPNRLPTYVQVSNQLLMQSNDRALTTILEQNLRRKLATLMEIAFINGSGTNAAEGILQTSGIGSVTTIVGSAAPTALSLAEVIALETEVAVDNADIGQLSYLMAARLKGKLKGTAKVASSDSKTLIDDANPDMLNGYGYAVSNGVPTNLTSGSTSNLTALIFGNFMDYYIAQWSGIELLVDPYSSSKNGLTDVNAAVYYDGHCVRPQSFAACSDAVYS